MKHRFLLISMILASAASCTESFEESCGNTPLTLSVRTGIPDSRSMITGTTLGAGEEIGITLTDDQGKNYDGMQYSNVRFRSSGTSSAQSWNADCEIMLSANKGTLYAYYPFSANVTDIRSIPISTTSDIQTDYMYAEPVTGLNNHNSEAPVTLKHALAAIRVILRRGNYTGSGNITAISVSGENMATGGILNATDGSISSLSGSGSAISPAISPISLDSNDKNIDIMAIPTGKSSSLTIRLTMDGEEFSVTTDAAILSKGMISIFEISINNSSVTIAPVQVRSWDSGQKVSTTLQKNWNITFDGDMDDIAIDSSVGTDGSVTITATPEYQDAEINPVTVTGTAGITESVQNGIRTIILSDIGSDVSISFNSYSLWVTAVYDITSTGSETSLVSQSSGFTRMEIDGEEVVASYRYKFDSTGEHTVRIMFSDKEEIPTNAFSYISSLRSISIPDGVTAIGSRCLEGCSSLTSVRFPQTLVQSGYEVMVNCSSLKSVVLPDNLVMGYGMFSSCYNLEEVILPRNLKTLESSTFYRCYKLTDVDIPSSVTTIESKAFASSGVTSVTLPAGLVSIGENAFNMCSSLSEIRHSDGTGGSSRLIFSEGLKTIGNFAFTGCSRLTAVHIPASVTKIGTGALTAERIESMTVAESNTMYKTVNGFTGIIEKSSGTLVSGACNSTVIPAEVTKIGVGAYMNLPISSIDLHEGITYIGKQAFYSNTNKQLKTIISRATTPPQLGTYAVFYGCQTGGTLKVPASAVAAYSSSSWMSNSEGFLGQLGWTVTALTE